MIGHAPEHVLTENVAATQPVTSGVTVDDEARLLPSPSWQTFATTESHPLKGRGGGRGGRLRTAPLVPPVYPSASRPPLRALELPELLVVAEVAALLRVSRSMVYALCDRGELQHVKVSGSIRVRLEDLDALTRSRCE